MTALELARFFHDTYERLAPDFGYETRQDTREFSPASKNGQLMVAVCAEVLTRLGAGSAASQPSVCSYTGPLVPNEFGRLACPECGVIPRAADNGTEPDAAAMAQSVIAHLAASPPPTPTIIKGPGRVTVEEAMQPFGAGGQPSVVCSHEWVGLSHGTSNPMRVCSKCGAADNGSAAP